MRWSGAESGEEPLRLPHDQPFSNPQQLSTMKRHPCRAPFVPAAPCSALRAIPIAWLRPRACLKIAWDSATKDFGGGPGGEAGVSRQRAVPAEPTRATGKRPAARRVFLEQEPAEFSDRRQVNYAKATRLTDCSESQPRVGLLVIDAMSLIEICRPRVLGPFTSTSDGLHVC